MVQGKPFEPGEHVYMKIWNGRISKQTVNKFYKNGNFVLCKDNQQFSPWGSGTGPGFHNPHVYHRTPETDAEYQAQEMNDRRVDLIDALRDLDRKALTDAGLAAIEAAIKGMKDGKLLDEPRKET